MQERDRIRAEVAAAHAQVAVGDYAPAITTFRAALPALTALLGGDHPEVQELADDLSTVCDMARVADFGAGLGLAWVPPEAGDTTVGDTGDS